MLVRWLFAWLQRVAPTRGRPPVVLPLLFIAAFLLASGSVASAATTIHVKAASLSDQQGVCTTQGLGVASWHFLINGVEQEALAPASITVFWGTTSEVVARDRFVGGVAHYTTSLHAGLQVTDATAVIYDGWAGQFNLSDATCGSAKASPRLTTNPTWTAPLRIGSTLNDSATLTGGSNPAGTITFRLFPPSDSNCSGAPSYTQTVAVTSGTAATSPGFVIGTVGTWNWTAVYSGDANNNGATSPCGEEQILVAQWLADDLQVSKTAVSSFTRTYTWSIAKDVDRTEAKTADGNATFAYTVRVSHAGTDSAWGVAGFITVTNTNAVAFEGVTVTDAGCTVQGGANATIPANGSMTFPYSCTPVSGAAGTNIATATWDAASYDTPHGSATGSAAYTFTSPTTIVDGSITVTDSVRGLLGVVQYNESNPKNFSYSVTFTGDPAGTCTTHNNTVTFEAGTTHASGTATQAVRVCVGADLVVAKTATPTFTRAYAWTLSKAVTPTLVQNQLGIGVFNYTVVVQHDAGVDSDWAIQGVITVTNPNDWEAIVVDIPDEVSNNGVCLVTDGLGVSVPAGGTVTRDYLCTYATAPDPKAGVNTAMATWDRAAAFTPSGQASGTAAFEFASPTRTLNQVVHLTDTMPGSTANATLNAAVDPSPQAYTYQKIFQSPGGVNNCERVSNTAELTEVNLVSVAVVEVCGPAKTGALTIGYWQNKNGQAILSGGGATSGVCNAATWLRLHVPFQDLQSTATCSQLAAYVTTVIKAANASGSTMNAMLKAQMLATALDVYYSDPALGGNKIGAVVPLGGVAIDLTNVPSIGNTSAAFGGATGMTVQQILTYAAGQANAGGTNWYGQVKAVQELAKDVFDAVNNRLAFPVP